MNVPQWLQETQNSQGICKLTCYQGIMQIWRPSFNKEMERFVLFSFENSIKFLLLQKRANF